MPDSKTKYIVIGSAYPPVLDDYFNQNYFKGKQNISNLIYERRLIAGMKEVLGEDGFVFYCVPNVGMYPFESKKARVTFVSPDSRIIPVQSNAWFWRKHRSQEHALERLLRSAKEQIEKDAEVRIIICEAYLPYLEAVWKVFGDVDRSIKKIVIVPDVPRTINNASWYRKLLKRNYLHRTDVLLSKADAFVLFSPQMKALKPYSLKPSIISLGLANFDRKSEGCELKKGKVVYAGKLDSMNAVEELIQAFDLVQHKDAELYLYGNGNVRVPLDNPRIHFGGFMNPEDLSRAIEDAQVRVCLRKPNEISEFSFPSKLVEALNSDAVVVANRLNSFSDDVSNYVVMPKDLAPESIAKAIDFALDRDLDLELRGKVCHQFHPAYLVQEIVRLFDEMKN